jgi:hypothetical protein
MKTDYYLQDGYYNGKDLFLVFFKGFYYNDALGIKEGVYKLTLVNAKIENLKPILNSGDKFSFEIFFGNNYSELLLIDEEGSLNKIKCDKIIEEEFSDTKEDLVLMIQDLEKVLTDYRIDLFRKNDFIGEIQSLLNKQLKKSIVVLEKADWLSEQKRIEEKTKTDVYNQILNLIENFKKEATNNL